MTPQFEIKELSKHRIFRFLSVGLLNTIFGYAVYAVLLLVNTHYLTALFIATSAGVVFNYYTFGRLVFNGHDGKLVFGKFIITYVMVYIANALLLAILTTQIFFSPYLAQVICMPVSVFLSWLLMNKWVYKNGALNAS